MSRKILYRTSGQNHGLITRLIHPRIEGELTKPFVFLDYINGHPPKKSGFGWHPHSGIATFTYYVEGSTDIQESTGNRVNLGVRDIEYLEAGSGVWHKGQIRDDSYAKGFQLWIALPPALQKQQPKSVFLRSEEITKHRDYYLLLGKYDGLESKITPPYNLNYLEVSLAEGESWTYHTPADHNILFIFLYEGDLSGDIQSKTAELIVFENGNLPRGFQTLNGAKFLLASAQSFDYELLIKGSSIHTSPKLLMNSMQRIREIQSRIMAA